MKKLIYLLTFFVLFYISCATSTELVIPILEYTKITEIEKNEPKCNSLLEFQMKVFTDSMSDEIQENAALEYAKCLKTQRNYYYGQLKTIQSSVDYLNNN